MRLALELEFPDEQAAPLMSRLQSLPGLVMRFLSSDALAQEPSKTGRLVEKAAPLTEQQQNELLDQVFGSWQQAEGEEDLMSQIYGSRRDAPREVDLG